MVVKALGYRRDPPSLINFPFTWPTSGFTYLGIHISSCVEATLKCKFQDVRKSQKFIRRRNLPVSWINLLKMNVYPSILYPLQMLEIFLSKKKVKEIERDISTFIWNSKKSRMRMDVLQLPKEKGGLTFPNIRMYSWACHGRIIREWIQAYLNGNKHRLGHAPLIIFWGKLQLRMLHLRCLEIPFC